MDIDHLVLWVSSAKRALDFYVGVLGLEPLRDQEFAEGKVRFPSVRINGTTILDLIESELLGLVQRFTGGGEGIGGAPINHLCLAMSALEFEEMSARLVGHGVKLSAGGEDVFGAQGQAVRSAYFNDPDGNVLEMRYYQ